MSTKTRSGHTATAVRGLARHYIVVRRMAAELIEVRPGTRIEEVDLNGHTPGLYYTHARIGKADGSGTWALHSPDGELRATVGRTRPEATRALRAVEHALFWRLSVDVDGMQRELDALQRRVAAVEAGDAGTQEQTALVADLRAVRARYRALAGEARKRLLRARADGEAAQSSRASQKALSRRVGAAQDCEAMLPLEQRAFVLYERAWRRMLSGVGR